MDDLITLDTFYQQKFNQTPDTLQPDSGHVNVIRIEDYNTGGMAEISYSLGFDEPTHFNNSFKKKTRVTPSFSRQG